MAIEWILLWSLHHLWYLWSILSSSVFPLSTIVYKVLNYECSIPPKWCFGDAKAFISLQYPWHTTQIVWPNPKFCWTSSIWIWLWQMQFMKLISTLKISTCCCYCYTALCVYINKSQMNTVENIVSCSSTHFIKLTNKSSETERLIPINNLYCLIFSAPLFPWVLCQQNRFA